MTPGVVVSFDPKRGFGFIRAQGYSEDVFVHVRAIAGARVLRPGQHVWFSAEPSEKGPRAVRVEPGRLGLDPNLTLSLALAFVLVGGTLAFRLLLHWPWLLAWLATINPVTFLAFALDKRQAVRQRRRIAEKSLLALALAGGSPSALVAMPLLRHKTRKESFRLAFFAVVAVQVGAALALAWRMLGGR
jgi:uncharacterized membrane protein YsdA (DUF1294 family)/cold shock CspA family protein